MPKLNIGTIDVSEDENDWLTVACRVSSESQRFRVSQIIKGHLLRFKQLYSKKVAYFARKYGMTWEQAFVLHVSREPPYSSEDIEWARTQTLTLAIESEEETNFGCEATTPKVKPHDDDLEKGDTKDD